MWTLPWAIKALIILSGIAMYVAGELKNKNLKYAMGIPIAVFGALLQWSFFPLWCALSYFIACELGYGEHNPLTLVVGKRWAITIHGAAVGLAAYPLIGPWCLLGGVMSGLGFYYIAVWDDAGWFKEPFVAIGRAFIGTILILIA
jgi:hypothetical protein